MWDLSACSKTLGATLRPDYGGGYELVLNHSGHPRNSNGGTALAILTLDPREAKGHLRGIGFEVTFQDIYAVQPHGAVVLIACGDEADPTLLYLNRDASVTFDPS